MYAIGKHVCQWQQYMPLAYALRYARIVTSPRFEPRSYLIEPEAFGRTAATWNLLVPGASGDARDQLQASKTQHSVVLAMRRRLRQKNMSVRGYADRNAINYQRLSSILRGQQIMRLEDIANAERNLGLTPVDWVISPRGAEEMAAKPGNPPFDG